MSRRSTEPATTPAWTDERLVRECLRGDDEAWSALLEKYQNLIFSIPIKLGINREDAADIFQSVCVDLLRDLPDLRQPKALPAWLMRVTVHRCLRWQHDRGPLHSSEVPEDLIEAPDSETPSAQLEEVEREQILRDSIRQLSPRCQRLMHELFFVHPPRSYRDIAGDLNLAVGSIGFIRGRCLEKLRRRLEEQGFP